MVCSQSLYFSFILPATAGYSFSGNIALIILLVLIIIKIYIFTISFHVQMEAHGEPGV